MNWSLFESEARREWPWRIPVVNFEKLSDLVAPNTSTTRLNVLLRSISDAAFDVSKDQSNNWIPFITPPGGWRRGEKEVAKRILTIENPMDVSDTFATSSTYTFSGDPWDLPWLPNSTVEFISVD